LTKKKFSGKSAVVTGAGSGIGRAIAIHLADLGATVHANDIDDGAIQATAQKILEKGGQVVVDVGDMGCKNAVKDLFAKVADNHDALDILVAQAGTVSWPEYIHQPGELTESEWRKMLSESESLALGRYLLPDDFHFLQRVNLHGTYYCCQEAIPLMEKAGGGRIVTMSATGGGITAHPFAPHYAAAKGAVVGLTRSLGRKLYPRNIVVNCIVLGTIDAGIWNRVSEEYPDLWEREWEVDGAGDSRTVKPVGENRLPLPRLGRPSEVAALVEYLSGEESSYLVGQCINLAGGIIIP